jgi:hypothetical protein
MSRIRHENGTIRPQYELVRGWSQKDTTHNECLQVHPTITEQEPDVTGNPNTTCSVADGHRGASVGVDGIWSYRKYRCVHAKCCF